MHKLRCRTSNTFCTGILQLILLQLGIGVMEDAYCTDILWNSGSAPGPLKSSSEPLFEQGLQQLLTSLAADLHRIDMNRIFAIEEKNAVAEAESATPLEANIVVLSVVLTYPPLLVLILLPQMTQWSATCSRSTSACSAVWCRTSCL